MFDLGLNNTSQNAFTLTGITTDLLGAYFNAKMVTNTVVAIQNTSLKSGRGPAVITPWDSPNNQFRTTLAGKFNAVRGKTNFINLNTKAVTQTQNKDKKALFALYLALNDLKTVADYAAASSTPTALLGGLNSQFRSGLAQVENFVRSAPVDKLTLMFGKMKSTIQSGISLGKNNPDIMGATLPVISKDQVIPNLVGNEVFTLKLDRLTSFDNITMDLSKVSGPLTLTNIVNYLNTTINAVTVPGTNGVPISKYTSRFAVVEVSKGKFALKFNAKGGEKATLTAQTSEPALYVTGSHRNAGFNTTPTATLTKIDNLASTSPITEFSNQIAGTSQNNFVPPVKAVKGKTTTVVKPTVFDTTANATAVDSAGNVYVVGSSKGSFGSQINGAAVQDVFLSKYDAAGNKLFTRLLGASGTAKAFSVVVDSKDNVIIAGQADKKLVPSDTLSGLDSFVTKFDKTGKELFTYQQDSVARDQANSLAIDAAGNIIVTGSIQGNLNATTSYGGASDVYVTKLDGLSGKLLDSTQIGGAGTELGKAVAIAGDGNILVASREAGHAIIRKLDATNLKTTLATYDLGNLAGGTVSGIAVDAAGGIYVAGTSYNGSLSGGTVTKAYSGSGDGFVTKLTDGGTTFSPVYTNFVGSAGTDTIKGLTVQNGAVYVAGKTYGTLPGAIKSGTTNGYVAKIDATTGATGFIRQFGGVSGYNGSSAIAFSAAGSSVITKLGLPTGLYDNSQTYNIETQTSARVGDYFYISVNGGVAHKISIGTGETYTSLAKKIQRVSFRFIKATKMTGLKGPELKIETFNGSTVNIIAGNGARDALVKLGIQPTKILPPKKLYAIGQAPTGTDPNNLGGVFALSLNVGFALGSKKEAAYISSQIDIALGTIKRAFRSLTFDPVKANLLKQAKLNSQPIPAELAKQLANYQDGVRRLSFIAGTTGSLII
ncbi:MAG: hypothetical protein GXP02_05300 [Alphaproteobacteria bacterium]|nr:hypothetical protein [Alphaproteobacteria bacterium]